MQQQQQQQQQSNGVLTGHEVQPVHCRGVGLEHTVGQSVHEELVHVLRWSGDEAPGDVSQVVQDVARSHQGVLQSQILRADLNSEQPGHTKIRVFTQSQILQADLNSEQPGHTKIRVSTQEQILRANLNSEQPSHTKIRVSTQEQILRADLNSEQPGHTNIRVST